MSTRAYISRKHNNEYQIVYNHFDGYPEHLGITLHKHFSKNPDPLFKNYSIRSINEKEIDFFIEEEKYIQFNLSEVIDKFLDSDCEFLYFHDGTGWFIYNEETQNFEDIL